MFLGALLGSRIALFLSTVSLRRIFIGAVLGLAIKLLLPAALGGTLVESNTSAPITKCRYRLRPRCGGPRSENEEIHE
jgi:hypothetical protein